MYCNDGDITDSGVVPMKGDLVLKVREGRERFFSKNPLSIVRWNQQSWKSFQLTSQHVGECVLSVYKGEKNQRIRSDFLLFFVKPSCDVRKN